MQHQHSEYGQSAHTNGFCRLYNASLPMMKLRIDRQVPADLIFDNLHEKVQIFIFCQLKAHGAAAQKRQSTL